MIEEKSVSRAAQLHDVSALSVKVQGLEVDVRDLKAGVLAIATEMRASFQSITNGLNERARTPWVSVFSAAAVVVTTLGLIGSLALTPLQQNNITVQRELEYREKAVRDLMDAQFQARDKSLDRIFQDLQGLKDRVEQARSNPPR